MRPVILARGAAVTSRELAEAAGVAEGTLFRVFTDKVTLVREAVLAAVDPADAIPEIEAIDRTLPLRDKLLLLMTQAQAHVGESMRWMSLLHEVGRLEPAGPTGEQREAAMRQWGRRQQAGTAAVTVAVRGAAGPRRAPAAAAPRRRHRALQHRAPGRHHPDRRRVSPRAGHGPPGPEQLVDLILHGVLAPTSSDRSS